jgi:hypothetical protein
MLEADFLRRQAETCTYLSRTTFDLGLAGRLRTMADDLRRRAVEIEHGDAPDCRDDSTDTSDDGAKPT